jgi:7-cyano-7-deazaguanine synthase
VAEKLPLAVVLLSGGMDSCVTAAIAAQQHRLALLHSSYGQRTEARERQAFEQIAGHFGAEHRLHLQQGYMTRIGGSALTDTSIEIPDADLVAAQAGQIPVTYVPFRNAHFLAAAVSWAEVLGAGKVFIGAVEQDSSGYPDCRPAYYRAFDKLIDLGTRPETHITIETPLIGCSKAEIVRRGVALGAPLGLTWSCYRSSELACGVCDSCALRRRAFEQAGVSDPIPYAVSAGKARQAGNLRARRCASTNGVVCWPRKGSIVYPDVGK